MKKTERIGFLSANDEKRPTGSTTRTPFAKWGRAGVDSLLDLLLPSDRSEELLGLGINISKRKIYVHLPNKTPSVAPPLLHGTERSAFTQERKTVRLPDEHTRPPGEAKKASERQAPVALGL